MANASRYALNKNKYLLPPEVERLEHLLRSHLRSDTRNCTLLFVLLHTGARATEVLNLKCEDLNIFEQTLFLKGIKGSNDRELPLRPEIFSEVESLAKDRPGSEHLFPISYNRLRQIWELYRPVHKKLHSLRHTFAIQLYKKTKDLRLVQFALGHRSISNTMIYADYVYSQQELKKLLL